MTEKMYEELKQLIEEEFDEMPEEDVKEYYYDVYCK